MERVIKIRLSAIIIACVLLSACTSIEELADSLGKPPTPTPIITIAVNEINPSMDANVDFGITNLPISGAIAVFGDSNCTPNSVDTVTGGFSSDGRNLNLTFLQAKTYNLSIQVFDIFNDRYSNCVPFTYTVLTPPVPDSIAYSGNPTGTANKLSLSYRYINKLDIYAYSDALCSDRSIISTLNNRGEVTLDDIAMGTQTIYFAHKNLGGVKSGCTTDFVTYTREPLPPPSSLALSSSTNTPSDNSFASIEIAGGGVQSGVIVNIYDDPTCSSSNRVATSSTLTSNSTSLNIYNIPPGTHNYYATTRIPGETESACSTASVSYTRNAIDIPSIALANGQASSSASAIFEMQVSGLTIGSRIRIYTDSTCLDTSQILNRYINATSMTFSYTVPISEHGEPLSLYAKQFSGGFPSGCSLTNATYTYLDPELADTLILDGWYPEYVSGGDFDNDGNIDIAATTGTRIDVFMGKGDGKFDRHISFSDGSSTTAPADTHVVDVNKDGFDDILLAERSDIIYIESRGDGTFKTPVKNLIPNTDGGNVRRVENLEVIDVNSDGHLDVLTTSYSGSRSLIVGLGDSNGSFNFNVVDSDHTPTNLFVTDINEDTHPDVIVPTRYDYGVAIFLNDGAGSYMPPTYISYSASEKAGGLFDYDGDGDQDILIWELNSNEVSFLENNSGTFTDQTSALFNTPSFNFINTIDNNQDGIQDLLFSHGNQDKISIVNSFGDTTFGTAEFVSQSDQVNQVFVGDLNNDGKDDIVKTNSVPNTNGRLIIALTP